MATPARRLGTDAAAPVLFSYAQAAKGMSSSTSPVVASKPASESATPSKDAKSTPIAVPTVASGMDWADESEGNDTDEAHVENPSDPRKEQVTTPEPSSKPDVSQLQTAVPTVSSPKVGTPSSSTLTKEDDVLSVQNNSSESTWENKSQASNPTEKVAELGDDTSEKSASKNTKESTPKTLQEAPIPAVNIWKQRADEARAKAALKASTAKPAGNVSSSANPSGLSQGPNGTLKKKNKGFGGADDGEVKEKLTSGDNRIKVRDDEKGSQARKDDKQDTETDRNRKTAKPRPGEKDTKYNSVLPLPPARDQESWPTPDSAIDEDRRKAQERGEKTNKEQSQPASSRGKNEWVPVPYTPSVVFNTPLPNAASARRGGRGGGRGGAQGGGRGGAYAASNAENTSNADHQKRGRPDSSAPQDSSSGQAKRTASAGSLLLKDSGNLPTAGDHAPSIATTPGMEANSRKSPVSTETASAQQGPGQNNTFPRQYQNRSNKGRRGDFSGSAERRKDGELVPSKENAASLDRRTSSATQTDLVAEDGDRRASTIEGQGTQQKQTTTDRRPYGSYSARDRVRGGHRGGSRGGNHGFQNGHNQFSNGPVPNLQPSTSFSLPRSPTAFQPDQNAFFTSGPGSRNWRGNGPRSQSITTDSMYNRGPAGYPGGPHPVAPLQAYVGGMYDYPMMQPMSAVPFTPYVDSFTLQNMVATQLEYYFSVENLCKDIFLRRHMDSKGFVFLDVIAGFNRIKQLTTEVDMLKLVCYNSKDIEWRVGSDGKDRLRRKEGWQQWVLKNSERDPSAQNEGAEELHHPPAPHPQTYDAHFSPRYTEGPVVSPTEPAPTTNGGTYQSLNGIHAGSPNNPTTAANSTMNGQVFEEPHSGTVPHAQPNGTSPHETLIPASHLPNGELDSFSDAQVESLSVIVRRQDQVRHPKLPYSATRTFSNGSIDSRNGVPDETDKVRAPSSIVNGTGPTQG
ncbi:hypothetical protein GQ43DRAFT_97450 [Delitschia confertaspora ATCC 74209]|uniref:HTH La-type RNA-binding domain-containing protein n=1 Tax=Delitschia confertaspora ATCC 74209 TaxID=1513339 RepID=A0A9P4JIS6_9PLEO|nr:hypothetical protein GQ43DRAFT_97450 [Delitschia confertaspora ATCC 74209]